MRRKKRNYDYIVFKEKNGLLYGKVSSAFFTQFLLHLSFLN